jgi:hypothetical protein
MSRSAPKPVRVKLARPEPLALLAAAASLAPKAYAAVDESGVSLWPRGPGSPAALAAEFRAEYESQRQRWALAKLSRAEELRRWGALLAQPAAPAPEPAAAAEPELPAEPFADPLGITTPWSVMRAKKSA